ncbi:MAG: efflux RND transporter permease subunit, partial [Chroococcales cyanobacterium]
DGFAEPQQSARFWSVEGSANSPVQATNPGEVGTPVVAFSVLRSTGSTLVTVEEGVRESIQELQQTLPDDLEFELIFTRADQIRDSYQASIDALVIGCLLTVCVVGIFLRDWRATLITGVALPLSIIPTFMVMELLDYTLNGMTLLALSLAVGNLVDDAICMIENIDQHLKMGKRPYQAAMDAAQEIGLAVLATTATIVAVFLPVAFMGGIPGQFFQPFGVTVSVSTLFSTLVATTMTPMLSAYLLKNKHSSGRKRRSKNNPTGKGVSEEMPNSPRRKITPYRTALTWALKHRVITLLIAFAFFIGSLQLVPYIPTGLFNSGDTGLSTVSLELPPGSTLRETDRTAQRTIALVQQHPAVESVLATVGSGGASRELNAATLFINLLPRQDREVSQQMFEQQMREEFTKIPGARISFQSGGAGGSSKDLSIVLKSENPAALQEAADTLERQIRELPGLVEVSSSASVVKPEILIKP